MQLPEDLKNWYKTCWSGLLQQSTLATQKNPCAILRARLGFFLCVFFFVCVRVASGSSGVFCLWSTRHFHVSFICWNRFCGWKPSWFDDLGLLAEVGLVHTPGSPCLCLPLKQATADGNSTHSSSSVLSQDGALMLDNCKAE